MLTVLCVLAGVVAVVLTLLVIAYIEARFNLREARDDLAEARRRMRTLELRNNELRQQLNHTCEHRACRLAKRIGLT